VEQSEVKVVKHFINQVFSSSQQFLMKFFLINLIFLGGDLFFFFYNYIVFI
jgi:hypothetical protein